MLKVFFYKFFEILETIIIVGLTVFVIRTFLVQPFLVNGSSMEPTFKDSDYLLVDEITYRFREPQRGEVIVFRAPTGFKGRFFIKRIIGLPDETVKIQKGKIIIFDSLGDEKILQEDYLSSSFKTPGNVELKLGPDEYFVLGDNRMASFDSRSWGVLPEEKIIGLAKLRLWPFNTAMAFDTPSY